MLLYQFLIAPLQVLFEYIFGLSNGLLNHYGFSILVLSLCMNLLLLPLIPPVRRHPGGRAGNRAPAGPGGNPSQEDLQGRRALHDAQRLVCRKQL